MGKHEFSVLLNSFRFIGNARPRLVPTRGFRPELLLYHFFLRLSIGKIHKHLSRNQDLFVQPAQIEKIFKKRLTNPRPYAIILSEGEGRDRTHPDSATSVGNLQLVSKVLSEPRARRHQREGGKPPPEKFFKKVCKTP